MAVKYLQMQGFFYGATMIKRVLKQHSYLTVNCAFLTDFTNVSGLH